MKWCSFVLLIVALSVQTNVNALLQKVPHRILVINCEDIPWEPISFFDMYHEKMSCENDIWSCCNVALGESIPKDFSDYDGIILTGSHYNCRKREVYFPWYENVIELIKTVDINGYPNLF